MEIDIETLQNLLARARREAPRTPAEKRAVEDADELLHRDLIEQGTRAAEGYYQTTLFDPTPYETGS